VISSHLEASHLEEGTPMMEPLLDPNEDNPALSRVIDQNIRTLVRLRLQAERARGVQDRAADALTAFSGRMVFVYIHIVWFAVWFVLNTGMFGIKPFDPFPYGLLTLIVSLEGIFLATFLLISQNRMAQVSERRADLDLHINLLAEHELTRALKLLDAIGEKLGIENPDAELMELEMDTRPEDVLAEIERLQHIALERRRGSSLAGVKQVKPAG
jgi:uncharacterized membrane protein